MSRATTRLFCPRSTLPPPPEIEEAEPEREHDALTRLSNEVMTWQQNDTFAQPTVSERTLTLTHHSPHSPHIA